MSESFLDGKVTLLRGDCLELLPTLAENSIDSCVTDPPYHLSVIKTGSLFPGRREAGKVGFMGKTWDGGDIAFRPELWAEVFRVLKPGAHLLAFSSTRTYHRMACAIEDAGFEIRDQIGWCYGSGFPKSHDISKAIDRMAGERLVVGSKEHRSAFNCSGTHQAFEGETHSREMEITAPATEAAIQWQGWGTALKPSFEPVVWAQKPYTPQQFLVMLAPTIEELICKVVSSAKTDTRLFGSPQAHGFLSTAISLSVALDDLLHRGSMCTTETAYALIIDLKILNSLLSKITHAITTGELKRINGGEFDVRSAVAISESVLAKCERLTRTTADELAISELAEMASAQAEGVVSPNWDCIVLARKPLSESSIASNVLKHGTGGINIDGCRIEAGEALVRPSIARHDNAVLGKGLGAGIQIEPQGRWPANLIHDGSEEVVRGFPESRAGTDNGERGTGGIWSASSGVPCGPQYGDVGSAARFFYTAKADADDRLGSKHPTVKPLDLIQYLVRLITPRGGLVLDPFAGTGTTAEAAYREGAYSILVEREPEYQADIVKRMGLCLSGPEERRAASVKQVGVEDTPLFGGL